MSHVMEVPAGGLNAPAGSQARHREKERGSDQLMCARIARKTSRATSSPRWWRVPGRSAQKTPVGKILRRELRDKKKSLTRHTPV
jgi:hypothetical protein